MLGSNGLSIDPDRIKTIREIAVPKHKTELQSFFGLVNYYRRFLRSLSQMKAALRVAANGTRFRWNDPCDAAMREVKRLIIENLVLAVPDLRCPFLVET